MKKSIFLGFMLSLSLGVFAQTKTPDAHAGHDMKMEASAKSSLDSEVQTSVNKLLVNYYAVKNALIADDGKTANAQAGELVKTLAATPMKKMTEDQHKVFMGLSDKIKTDAEQINKNTDVKQQRDRFNDLSNNVFALVKGLKANVNPVYQQYCPMKKAYWLSDNAAVKNPYYGKAMLTCGKVTETLK
jgi:small-conductance mechanosensitive channel